MRCFLPSLKDWLQTLWVFLLLFVWSVGLTVFWRWVVGEVGEENWYLFLSINPTFTGVWILINFWVIPLMGFTYTHWFLWGKDGTGFPWWLPSLHSWAEGMWQWGIMFFGWLIPLVVLFFFDFYVMGIEEFRGDRVALEHFIDQYLGSQMVIMLIFWILFVGECWMIRRRLTQWWKKRKEEKGGSSTPTE